MKNAGAGYTEGSDLIIYTEAGVLNVTNITEVHCTEALLHIFTDVSDIEVDMNKVIAVEERYVQERTGESGS